MRGGADRSLSTGPPLHGLRTDVLGIAGGRLDAGCHDVELGLSAPRQAAGECVRRRGTHRMGATQPGSCRRGGADDAGAGEDRAGGGGAHDLAVPGRVGCASHTVVTASGPILIGARNGTVTAHDVPGMRGLRSGALCHDNRFRSDGIPGTQLLGPRLAGVSSSRPVCRRRRHG